MKPKLQLLRYGMIWASLQFLARVSFYTLTLGAVAYTVFMVVKVFVKNPVEVLASAALLVLPALFVCALIRVVIWAGDRCDDDNEILN